MDGALLHEAEGLGGIDVTALGAGCHGFRPYWMQGEVATLSLLSWAVGSVLAVGDSHALRCLSCEPGESMRVVAEEDEL